MIPDRRKTRYIAPGAVTAFVLVLMAACSSSNTPLASPTKPATSSMTPSTSTTSASASASSTPHYTSSSTSTPLGPSPCPTHSLAAKVGVAQGTAGSAYQVIDFTNISNVSCTLYGYPGVAFARGLPVSRIGLAATESTGSARTLVTLAPKEVANALLQIVDAGNYPTSVCGPVTATYLQIYPPNQTTPIYLSYTDLTCSKPVQILTVRTVQRGAGSS
jgi:Protein of unknown function (DUF4232)